MAFIDYLSPEEIDPKHQVDDRDHIIQIHGIHPEMIKLHHSLYRELMHGKGALSRALREMIGVLVSSINQCHY